MPNSSLSAPISISRHGHGPKHLVFIHGLMGRGKNFQRFTKDLAEEATTYLVDMPNHGESGWTEEFSFEESAELVADAIRDATGGEAVYLVGHSLGGKVAMVLALTHPELVKRLMVVDISPADSGDTGKDFEHLLGTLRQLDLEALEDRADAEEKLTEPIPSRSVRGFLMQNLRYKDGQFSWQPNLELLYRSLDEIAGFPQFDTTYDGAVMWLSGSDSDYVQDQHEDPMRALFPRAVKITVKDAGHWVHAEQPATFLSLLRQFLRD